MRIQLWVLPIPLVVASAWTFSSVAAWGQAAEVPKEVRALEGTYTGAWTMYGIDGKGDIVKRMAWTDTMKAANSEIQGDRAFVKTTDEMMFEGDQIPPMMVAGKEGYFVNEQGGLGDYFIETNGQTYRMVKVGENVWSYTTSADVRELSRLGFPASASGKHVLVKVITTEQGLETHQISRLTTVSWKDKEGQDRTLQFITLQGFHKRQR